MKVVVIGGGISGLFTALYLIEGGHTVTLIDAGDFDSGCSWQNAGMITPSHFVPLASPSTLRNAIRWMVNSKSPLFIKPRLSTNFLRWCWHFLRSCNGKNITRGIPALNQLLQHSSGEYERILKKYELNALADRKGILMIYQTSHIEKEEIEQARIAQQLGLRTTRLGRDELQQLFPDNPIHAIGAMHYHDDWHLDPAALMRSLKSYLIQQQVEFISRSAVQDFLKNGRKIRAVLAGGKDIPGDVFVMATGVSTGSMASQLGIYLPITGGKGYSVTVDAQYKVSDIPFLLLEGRVAVTPTSHWFRVAGTMEMGTPPHKILKKRVTSMLDAFLHTFPSIDPTPFRNANVWSGLRPLSPDGLPFIGRCDPYENVFVNAGHAMTGMGMAPGSAHLICRAIEGDIQPFDITPFTPARFS